MWPKTSVEKKQIVAVTGLLLIFFIIGHLVGNLLIFLGPKVYNGYAQKLASLRYLLYVVEIGLTLIFLVHIHFTALLVLENIRARGQRYSIYSSSQKRSLAARLMPITGTILFLFVIFHLKDFTLSSHDGPNSVVNGVNLGLYGLVINSLSDPFRCLFYIAAMISIGIHLSHGIQSFFQSFGLNHPKYTPMIINYSKIAGFLVGLTFSSIPIYIFLNHAKF